jgi:hypothetical protein
MRLPRGQAGKGAGKNCKSGDFRAASENFTGGRASTGIKEEPPMAGRTTLEVVSDHLALAQMGEVWRDLERNLAPDCVILTTYGVFHGHEGAMRAAQLLDDQVGETRYDYRSLLFHGEIGFLEWSADGPKARVRDGADSYWVRDGKIQVMTIHYTIEPKRKLH